MKIISVVDFAAMRDAVLKLGGDPDKINPTCPSDLVIDHSIQVDFSGTSDALAKNQDLEFERNKERFTFLKWGAKAFNNMLIIPPGSGIVHQVNLEYLARVVFADKRSDGSKILYPDSVVGTDSHTTMINGLGVLGWGVGGIEAEAVMLGQVSGSTSAKKDFYLNFDVPDDFILVARSHRIQTHRQARLARHFHRFGVDNHQESPRSWSRRQVCGILRPWSGLLEHC